VGKIVKWFSAGAHTQQSCDWPDLYNNLYKNNVSKTS